jgi:hypothetical protein
LSNLADCTIEDAFAPESAYAKEIFVLAGPMLCIRIHYGLII